MDGGAWKAAVHGVAEGRTWLSDFTFTFHFHALEKEMATHSSVLAWRIPWTEKPGGLQSMGSHRVRHDRSDSAAAAAADEEERKKGWEYFWRDYCWKFPQHGKGNSQSISKGTKSLIQDKPKEKHVKTHTNQTNKDQTQRKNVKSCKGEATSNIQGKPHLLNSWSLSRNSAGRKGMAGCI